METSSREPSPDAPAEPAFDATRRIRLLAMAVLGAIALYTAGWFGAAAWIERGVARSLDEVAEDGGQAECSGRTMRGYPFRIGLFCDAVAFRSPADQLSIAAGPFRTAAQVYAPSRLVAELDGPLLVDAPGLEPLRLDWASMRSSARLAAPLPERFSLEGRDIVISLVGSGDEPAAVATAAGVQAHMRQNGPALDLAASAASLRPAAADEDAMTFEMLLTFDDREGVVAGMEDGRGLRGQAGRIETLSLSLDNKDAGATVAGPFAFSPDGLLTATVKLEARDPTRLAEAIRALAPGAAAGIEPLLAGLAAMSAASADGVARLEITVRDGVASTGLIPLGKIPPLAGDQ